MSADKFEHKDELDCEVTVFEGAHNTCDPSAENSPRNKAAQKTAPSKEMQIKDNYNI